MHFVAVRVADKDAEPLSAKFRPNLKKLFRKPIGYIASCDVVSQKLTASILNSFVVDQIEMISRHSVVIARCFLRRSAAWRVGGRGAVLKPFLELAMGFV